MKALTVNIYKPWHGDCSNNGLSSKYDKILLLCDDGNHTIDPDNIPENLCHVITRKIGKREVKHVEPVAKPSGAGWMYGGCYVGCSDARFFRLAEIYGALTLHDRQETWEQNERLSN